MAWWGRIFSRTSGIKAAGLFFYRYGGMHSRSVLDVTGEKVLVITRPDGEAVPDQRLAFPVLPSWEEPIVPREEKNNVGDAQSPLLNNRYAIETAVSFSSAGGVYYARDQESGKRVVVKEARPFIQSGEDCDAVALLKKEHRLLTMLADTGIAPQPVDLFKDWEHWFLVQEYLEGVSIWQHAASSNLLLRSRTTAAEHLQWSETFSTICTELVRILGILHSRGIVFGDLSTSNIIITAALKLKIIDFEGAHQIGVDQPADIYTPGFLSEHRRNGGEARPEDDYYAAGAVLLACLLPINGLLHLNPNARQKFLAAIACDLPILDNARKLINTLMDTSGLSSAQAIARTESVPATRPSELHGETVPPDYDFVVEDIVRHLNGIAEYTRNDRLYPADPQLFATNPLSVAYGAAGVAYALHRISGHVPSAAVEWICAHPIDPDSYPPGLYVGMSGIAWSLLEMGFTEKAEAVFQSACGHPLVFKTADIFHGIAGWGMTALRFFQATDNESYLAQAQKAGDSLLASPRESESGFHWGAGQGLGLAHGSSGVALFLLYLFLVTRKERYLAVGLKALNFDLAAAVPTKDGGFSWSKSVDSTSIVYPFWRFGSAGIGIVVARYYSLLRLPRLGNILEKIFIDADRKFAVFPGRFSGLAGTGEFLLDMYDMSGEQRFLESARRIADGIILFRVEREGSAFPGEMSSRLSCDYGTGSAGIALFLNRLLGRQGSDFLMDSLLPETYRNGGESGISDREIEYAAMFSQRGAEQGIGGRS
jgi:serine/threonine protein kinase